MKREEAKAVIERNPYNSIIAYDIIDKIYTDFKIELEAEYQRGRDDVLSRSCEGCEHFEDSICYNNLVCLMNGGEYILTSKEFSCHRWEQKWTTQRSLKPKSI